MTSLHRAILERGLLGINTIGEFVLKRAQYHAPVRHIFDGRKIRNPRGPAFKGSTRNWTAADYKALIRSRRKNHVVQNVSKDIQRGNIASLRPVFRVKGIGTMTGDLRQFNSMTNDLARTEVRIRRSTRSTQTYTIRSDANAVLSNRGRREVARSSEMGETTESPADRRKKGIKTFSALYQGRIGGRLRGEIYLQKATLSMKSRHWAYVISPTEYAIHQEYGTSRHRAHPFLRPALYEARPQLREVYSKGQGGQGSSIMVRALQTGRVGR